MRFFPLLGLCALWCACGKPAELTPPIQAPLPASDEDREAPPSDRLPADTHPESYRLDLEIDPDKPNYRGSVAIDLTLDRPRRSIWLHARGPRVASVQIERPDAEPLIGTLERVGESGLSAVRLQQAVGPGRVRIALAFEADFGAHLSGLYRADAAGVHYAFTQFEPISAREAFPCFDEPRFKTPFAVTLRVPAADVAVANTRALDERELSGGMREVRFAPTEKLPTYLIAFAVGPFDVASAPPLPASDPRPHELPLRGLAVRGRGPDLRYALRETPSLLTWLERYFAIGYPYDKLDLIAVPDFGAGAMENAGAITFRDTLLLVRDDAPEQQKRTLGYVNAHELAHQWFGNLVTMPWWDDIWLNEAFATWMGTRAIAEVHPEYEAALGALSAAHGAMEVDSRAAARKIRQPIESDHDIENAFDAITYSKGGSVLSMFERYLGAEQFQRGLRAYMERYRFGNATARDLVRTLAETSGQEALEPAFFSFLDQPGVPLVQVTLDCQSKPPALALEQTRYLPLGSSANPAATWQIPLCVRYSAGGASKEQCALLREQKAQVPLDAKSCPTWLMPNAGAQGYYRWALSDVALQALVGRRADLTAPEQMSLASNLGAAFRGGRIDPARLLAAQRLLAGAPNRHVVETVLKTYGLVRELLVDPSLPAFRAELQRVLRPKYQQLGLLPRKGASVGGEEKLWRASIVRALFSLAEDPGVTRELARLGRSLLESGALETPAATASAAGAPSGAPAAGSSGASSASSAPSGAAGPAGVSTGAAAISASPARATAPAGPAPQVPSELLDLVLTAALREGGAPLFERAQTLLFASSDGLTRARLLSALSYQRDTALSERALDLSLDPRLRTNERLTPLFAQSSMPETRERAWAWLRTHYDALAGQLGAHGGNDVVSAMGGLCSEEQAREVEAFFGPKAQSIPGGPRELSLTLESIRGCAALAARYREPLNALYTPAGKRASAPAQP